MSSTVTPADPKPKSTATSAETKAQTANEAAAASKAAGIERRRRRRAKISAQVHVRAAESASSKAFKEVCMTVDVSRDGLLLMARRTGYWKGQRLDVTFPYSSAPGAINHEQAADVVRVQELPGKQYAVAVQFQEAKMAAKDERKGATLYAKESKPVLGAPVQEAQKQSLVLAVEPDPRTAEMMRTLLQQDGYTVVTVSTAKEALEILRTTVPAVFLAEVETEDVSGHDLCLIIKRDERLQRVPVILLTRSATPADYSASHQLGAVVCMAKPFKPERLQHVVRLVAPPPTQQSVYGARLATGAKVERVL